MWMFRGVDLGSVRVPRPASSWVAFLMVSTEETEKRLGIVEARGLHLSGASQQVAANKAGLEKEIRMIL